MVDLVGNLLQMLPLFGNFRRGNVEVCSWDAFLCVRIWYLDWRMSVLYILNAQSRDLPCPYSLGTNDGVYFQVDFIPFYSQFVQKRVCDEDVSGLVVQYCIR